MSSVATAPETPATIMPPWLMPPLDGAAVAATAVDVGAAADEEAFDADVEVALSVEVGLVVEDVVDSIVETSGLVDLEESCVDSMDDEVGSEDTEEVKVIVASTELVVSVFSVEVLDGRD